MPEGICPLPSSSEYCSDSDLSSLASGRADQASNSGKEQYDSILHRSVSDVDHSNVRQWNKKLYNL